MPSNHRHGLVIVNTGEGKGKSTAAFGTLLRAWGRGFRICVIQFIKAETGRWGEIKAAGLAALGDEPYYQATLAQLRDEKTFLLNGLKIQGFSPVPSQTQFFLLPVENTTQFRQTLLRQGLLVRDCTSFGLSQHIRISPRTRPENQRLLDVLHLENAL